MHMNIFFFKSKFEYFMYFLAYWFYCLVFFPSFPVPVSGIDRFNHQSGSDNIDVHKAITDITICNLKNGKLITVPCFYMYSIFNNVIRILYCTQLDSVATH